jgi:hypothetical protein
MQNVDQVKLETQNRRVALFIFYFFIFFAQRSFSDRQRVCLSVVDIRVGGSITNQLLKRHDYLVTTIGDSLFLRAKMRRLSKVIGALEHQTFPLLSLQLVAALNE